MSSKWFVIQVLSGQEKKVRATLLENRSAAGLLEIIEDVVVPSENVAEVKAGQQKVTEKRLWPGYILVKMILTDDSWMYTKDSFGVIGFLGSGKPAPLADVEVEEILADLEGKKDSITQKHDFDLGSKIKIVDGVFVNFTGVVTEVSQEKGKVCALVSIFGRDTKVDDLEFWQVEKLPDDADLE